MSDVQAPKILVIEDETTQRILAKEYLEESGFVVRLADDGRRGLEMASAINPDLIILDLLLPSMDGYTLCTRLKENPDTAEIPVILVTAAREADVIERGMAAGASDFVTKPVDWSYLSDRVSHVLQQSQDMKRLAAEKHASEQKLLAILESQDLTPEQIEEIKQLSVAPSAAPAVPSAPAGIPLEEFERQIQSIRLEADERVRRAEVTADERIRTELEARRTDIGQAAQQSAQVAQSFWSLISHISQTHLPMLTALDQLTSGTATDNNAAEYPEISLNGVPQNAVQSLLASTRNMGILARDMAGEPVTSPVAVDLVALVAEAVNRIQPHAEQRQVSLNVVLPESPVEVAVDPAGIRRALMNLVTNALKHCPQNTSVAVELSTGPGDPVRLTVTDNGIGMAPALAEGLRSCHTTPMNVLGGHTDRLGLGVPMSMAIMKAHDGHMVVESEVGKGTTMTLSLPDTCKCGSQQQEPERESLTDKSAARREDVPIARLNALLAS